MVMKPLIALVLFVYLAVIDFYVAALAFAVLFQSSYVPQLHLSLPLLMGLLWPGLAVAWAEGLTDAAGPEPRRPYITLKPKTRAAVVGVLWLGLLAALGGNIPFWLWRQAQLAAVNPYGSLTYVKSAWKMAIYDCVTGGFNLPLP